MSNNMTRSMDQTSEIINETAIKEVQNLLKDNTVNLNPDIINKLRSKYSDENIVDSIMEHFIDRRNKITKTAEIFMNAFERKYKNNFHTMSLSKFMKTALKYKKKYNLSDDEFEEIRRIFESRVFNSPARLTGQSDVVYPNTNLSRVLGYPITESTDQIKPSNPDDYGYLQDILRTYEMFRSVHSHIVIQTMTYTDLAEEALNGKFEPNKHDVNRYVHPVLAALFLPKITLLEERMLYANISGIINTKYHRERIITKPDYELFYSMVVDPADIICDNISPMRDLKNRTDVQVQLWNNVYNLRSGKFFEPSVLDFVSYIDKCRISNVDNPDVLYLSDEGVILRRLFAIFSYRPIIVLTQPVFGGFLQNPLNLPINTNVITSIPYITYKLPNVQIQGNIYKLTDSNNQVQFYLENGSFVPKVTTILTCNGPLIFYIPRRSVGLPMEVSNPQLQPFNIQYLQPTTRNYHLINGVEVQFEQTIELNSNNTNKQYYIRSIVAFEKYQNTNMILGHSTYLFKYMRNSDQSIMGHATPLRFAYLPRRANLLESKQYAIIQDDSRNDVFFRATVETCGTIFIYAEN